MSFRILPDNLGYHPDLVALPVKVQLAILAIARTLCVLKFAAVCADVANRHIRTHRLTRVVKHTFQPKPVSWRFAMLDH